MNCWYCDIKIDKTNRTDEHIIPNAIGGRLKSNLLICRGCNNLMGSSIDSPFIKQFEVLCNLLDINRQKGKSIPIELNDSHGRKIFRDR